MAHISEVEAHASLPTPMYVAFCCYVIPSKVICSMWIIPRATLQPVSNSLITITSVTIIISQ